MASENNIYVTLICLTAGLGGFLFGYDTAVISGAIGFLRDQFHLNAAMEGWIMSSALTGCILGAAIAGWLADRFGRRTVLLASAVLFILSSLGCADAGTASTLVVWRIVGGLGVGFAAMVAPMYIAEMAPANIRGRLVSFYQLAITIGILLAYIANAALLYYAGLQVENNTLLHFYLVAEVWRAMLGSNIVPATLFFILLLFIPESPRWLIKARRMEKARRVMVKIPGAENMPVVASATQQRFSDKNAGLKQLFKPGIRIALLIGLVLPFLSQWSGITTVMYYAPAILTRAGFHSTTAMGNAAVIGFFNIVFTFVAIWKIDRWGRKPLLIWGFAGLSIALVATGLSFDSGSPLLLLGLLVGYIAVFAATLGPGIWVLLSEIYPTDIRGRAMSLGTLSLFVGSAIVTQTYPLLRDFMGIGATFILYGLIMVPTAFFVKRFVPETKGRALEAIEDHWKKQAEVSITSGRPESPKAAPARPAPD